MRDYGFITTLDDEIMRDPKRDVGYGLPTLEMRCLWDLTGTRIYGRLDDAQTDSDRCYCLERLGVSMERVTLYVLSEVMALLHSNGSTAVRDRELGSGSSRMRTTQLTRGLKLMKTLQTQLTGLFRSRTRTRYRGPTQPDAPEEAGSSS
ncbi:hypothetical protein Tco_0860956 [Tanacetum coccineum]|uniref:Uncharacterized protein n=1 Tax=Tanacetum coccineum TaxID=301880 RepID=A0ABQ5BM39_9ASTR